MSFEMNDSFNKREAVKWTLNTPYLYQSKPDMSINQDYKYRIPFDFKKGRKLFTKLSLYCLLKINPNQNKESRNKSDT